MKNKKVMSWMLCLVLAFGFLTGCGGEGTETQGDTVESGETVAAQGADEAPGLIGHAEKLAHGSNTRRKLTRVSSSKSSTTAS